MSGVSHYITKARSHRAGLLENHTCMKKSLFSFFIITILCFLAACGGKRGNIIIEGEFKHLDQGEFYAFSVDPTWGTFDTLKVNNGEFSLDHPLEDTTIVVVQYPNFMQMFLVAIPGHTISIKGEANNLLATKITGCDENKMLTKFRLSNAKNTDAQKTHNAEDFIRKNPESFASLALYYQFFVETQQPDYSKMQALLGLMLKSAPERTALKTLQAKLNPLFICRKGVKLPTFNTVSMNRTPISNQTLKGKYALLSFWSTWGVDYMKDVQNEQTLLTPYLSKVQLINFSLDTDSAQVARQIDMNHIPGINICDKLSWTSPIVRTFGIVYLPSNILVNPQGVIVGRDMKPNELTDFFKKTFR